jgi:3-hydroxyacyl-[acyl-carrier-protein] dehydratase
MSQPAPHARPAITFDEVVALDESRVAVRAALAAGAACFQGHYPSYPIFPGVFAIELVQQAARLFCERHFAGARLVRVGARFLAPVLPGAVLLCDCACKRLPGGEQLQVQGACFSEGVKAAQVKLVYSREAPG